MKAERDALASTLSEKASDDSSWSSEEARWNEFEAFEVDLLTYRRRLFTLFFRTRHLVTDGGPLVQCQSRLNHLFDEALEASKNLKCHKEYLVGTNLSSFRPYSVR